MPQIEFKDLNSSLSAESFLEDLTDEAVHIVGGTIEDSFALASSGFTTSLARTKEYISSIETTLANLPATENHGANYSFFYTTNLGNSAHSFVVFKPFPSDV
jgi:hypothetical protein